MEKLKALLDGNKDKLNAWFYDATDAELLESIKFLCSKEITDKYPKEFLSEYTKEEVTLPDHKILQGSVKRRTKRLFIELGH